jgi:predicted transcriptional regulator
MRMWAITKVGKKASRNIQTPDDDERRVLNLMHDYKMASTEDVSMSLNISETRALAVLNKLANGRMVVETTKEDSYGSF